jgi:hypothetical protein
MENSFTTAIDMTEADALVTRQPHKLADATPSGYSGTSFGRFCS